MSSPDLTHHCHIIRVARGESSDYQILSAGIIGTACSACAITNAYKQCLHSMLYMILSGHGKDSAIESQML